MSSLCQRVSKPPSGPFGAEFVQMTSTNIFDTTRKRQKFSADMQRRPQNTNSKKQKDTLLKPLTTAPERTRTCLYNAKRFPEKKLPGSQASPTCPSDIVVKINWSWNNGWKYTVSGKPKQSERNVLHCHFIHHDSQADWPQIETGPLWLHLSDKTPKTRN